MIDFADKLRTGDVSKSALESEHPGHRGRIHALKDTVAGSDPVAAP